MSWKIGLKNFCTAVSLGAAIVGYGNHEATEYMKDYDEKYKIPNIVMEEKIPESYQNVYKDELSKLGFEAWDENVADNMQAIVNEKENWQKAHDMGDIKGMEIAEENAKGYYQNLVDSGNRDIADTMHQSDYETAKGYFNEYNANSPKNLIDEQNKSIDSFNEASKKSGALIKGIEGANDALEGVNDSLQSKKKLQEALEEAGEGKELPHEGPDKVGKLNDFERKQQAVDDRCNSNIEAIDNKYRNQVDNVDKTYETKADRINNAPLTDKEKERANSKNIAESYDDKREAIHDRFVEKNNVAEQRHADKQNIIDEQYKIDEKEKNQNAEDLYRERTVKNDLDLQNEKDKNEREKNISEMGNKGERDVRRLENSQKNNEQETNQSQKPNYNYGQSM